MIHKKMGTDIYLRWKGMNRYEVEKQFTGFDIGFGNVGYLRASIGMARENKVLRTIFPEQYWSGEKIKGRQPYDFKTNISKVVLIGISYLTNCLTGKDDFPISEGQEQQIQAQEIITKALASAGFDQAKIRTYRNNQDDPLNEFRFGVNWLNSLLEFFDLGIEKQDRGLRPYPSISW